MPLEKSFYTIREVSSMLDVPAYTPRYWETVFPQLCPVRVNSHRKTIGVRRSIDELAHADAKILGIPDLSNIATIDLANKKESILRSTLPTEITPDIFKSGADSIAAMLLPFTDEIIWKKRNGAFLPRFKIPCRGIKSSCCQDRGALDYSDYEDFVRRGFVYAT